MKKLLFILLLFSALISHAQESFFKVNNKFVAPAASAGPNQATTIATNGLLLHLDAANTASYPGTGTTWTNLVTGNSVTNFVLNNNVNYNAANGGVLRFADGGWASTTSSFGRLANYTIEIWVKIAGTSGPAPNSNYTPCLFSDIYNGSINMILAYNGYNFPTSPDQFTTGYYDGGWNTFSTSSNTSDLNNWIHIVATYDGGNCVIYKNGVVIGSGAIGNNPNTSNEGYFIGHRWDMPDLVFGDYSMVNLYNRALSPTEITSNFNVVKSRFGL
jgi:hypothetical protein